MLLSLMMDVVLDTGDKSMFGCRAWSHQGWDNTVYALIVAVCDWWWSSWPTSEMLCYVLVFRGGVQFSYTDGLDWKCSLSEQQEVFGALLGVVILLPLFQMYIISQLAFFFLSYAYALGDLFVLFVSLSRKDGEQCEWQVWSCRLRVHSRTIEQYSVSLQDGLQVRWFSPLPRSTSHLR